MRIISITNQNSRNVSQPKSFFIRSLIGFEKVLYSVRDAFWSYPQIFDQEKFETQPFFKLYISSVPYSHFVFSGFVMLAIFLVVFVTGVPKIVSYSGNNLKEGVVMGVGIDGAVQKISKVNPILPSNVQLEKDLVSLIYEPLLTFEYVDKIDDGTQIGGAVKILAKEIITLKPGADYQFNLRQDVYWHDSSSLFERKFSAEDVIKTFDIIASLDDSAISTENVNAYTRALKELQWQKIDDYTVRVCTIPANPVVEGCDTRNDSPIFSNFLELLSFKIIPAHLSGDIDNSTISTSEPALFRSPVGTGRYKFRGATDTSVNLTLNESYHDLGKVYKTVEIKATDKIKSFLSLNSTQNQELELLTSDYFSKSDVISEVPESFESYSHFIIKSIIDEQKLVVDLIKEIPAKDLIQNIEFVYYPDLESAVEGIKNGEIHSLVSTSTEFKNSFVEYKNIDAYQSPVLQNQFWALYFNLRETPDGRFIAPEFLSDPNVRYAISLAIDKDDIVEDTLDSLAQVSQGPIPSKSFFFNPAAQIRDPAARSVLRQIMNFESNGQKLWTYNPELSISQNIDSIKSTLGTMVSDADLKKVRDNWFYTSKDQANAILDKTDWQIRRGATYRTLKTGETMEFDLYFVESFDRRKVAEAIRDDLQEVGIRVNINTAPASEGWNLKDLNDQVLAPRFFDVILYGMNTFIDPDRYELYHSSQIQYPGLNIAGYVGTAESVVKRENRQEGESSVVRVPKIDKLLDDARRFDPVKNRNERRDNYLDLQELIADDAPIVYLYSPRFIYFINNRIGNINLDGVSSIEERFDNIWQWI